MPYTHLRTFRRSLFLDIPNSKFQDEDGNWLRAGGDTAIFYEVLERADPMKVKALQRIVYNYNDTNPLNDYKVNGVEQTRTANKVLGAPHPQRKLLAVYGPELTPGELRLKERVEAQFRKAVPGTFVPGPIDLRRP